MTNLMRTIEETGEILEAATLSPEAVIVLFIMSTILLVMMTWEEKRQERGRNDEA